MPLVEIIYDDNTSNKVVKSISEFITHRLGKTIIKSNDTPGFIANRIGCFLMELCLREAYEKKLSILDIDNYFTKELGLPSTGIFGLFDLIGLDVMQMISGVLARSLSKEDEFCKTYKKYDWYDKMLADGYKGRKGLGGFYRMREADGKKIKEVLDFKTMEYRHCEEGAVRRGNLSANDDIASIIQSFFAYVNSLLGIVSSSKEDIDTAMKLGYSWKKGPFDMMREYVAPSMRSAEPGSRIDKRWIPDISLAKFRDDDLLLSNQSAYLYEVAPKILVFSIKTKMNILDENVFNLLIESVDYAEKHNAKKLIIYNEGKHFSAGANLKLFLEMGEKGDLDAADKFLELGQRAMMRVKYSKVPVIACAKGVALGGGCELLLHARKIFAHLDLSAGLVEVGVGLIPGWGGCKEMILHGQEDNAQITKNLRNIITQNKSSSAYGFFHDYMIENGEVVMNEPDLLNRAIDWDVDVAHEASLRGAHSVTKQSHSYEERLPRDQEIARNDNRKIDLISSCVDLKLDAHTIFIVKELQDAINSASLSEMQVLEIEKTLFKKLVIMPETLDKIRSVV